MRAFSRVFLIAAVSLALTTCFAQDEPSLGDVARQTRQQKQAKATQAKDAKPARVITDQELPEHTIAPTASMTGSVGASFAPAPSEKSAESGKLSAESWRSQIQEQKNQIATLHHDIDELNNSIQFAPGNCVENCVQWNEHQKEKQQEVERMRGQLDDLQKHLEDMQEQARRQGYGSSVYDP
jgi:chromosome segregation ATPase